jgi:DNA-nicking Smr family endonuclease
LLCDNDFGPFNHSYFSSMKARSLQDLEGLKRTLSERAALEENKRKEKALQEIKRLAEQDLFKRAIGSVQPISANPRVLLSNGPALPIASQQIKDDQSALRESLSDEFDVASLLDTDDALSFRRPGIGTDITKKLRKGDWSVQAQVDLHGLRRDEAREHLSAFLKESIKSGLRCIRVIHGKGLGSPGKAPVLKAKVQSWLVQKEEILAFVQAKPTQGGAGALIVLLKGR